MANTIVMPKLGVTMEEGRIDQWKFETGDYVEKGTVLVVIESDKVALEYEAPETGHLLEITAKPGDIVAVGKPICIFGEQGETIGGTEVEAKVDESQSDSVAERVPTAVSNEMEQSRSGKVKAVPMVRKMAREQEIDLTQVPGTGPGNRITKQDVLNYVEQQKSERSQDKVQQASTGERLVKEVIPLTGMRGAIARNMTQSILEAPQGTQFLEIDATEVKALQEMIKPAIQERTGAKLSLTAMLVKTVGKALEMHPMLNSIVEDNEVKVIQNINIGIAVSANDGLLVPVIHDVQEKSLGDIVNTLVDITTRARENKLTAVDMSGGTFTITNLGMYGAGFFTPLINPPESAILGVGGITKKQVVVDDEVCIRPMMSFALTIDHRSIDGVPAAQFFATIKELLETPWQKRLVDVDY